MLSLHHWPVLWPRRWSREPLRRGEGAAWAPPASADSPVDRHLGFRPNGGFGGHGDFPHLVTDEPREALTAQPCVCRCPFPERKPEQKPLFLPGVAVAATWWVARWHLKVGH